MDKDLLDRAVEIAFARLRKVKRDLAALPEPLRVVAIVCSAQGVIDNGGLRYFFENDWPRQPPYAQFVDAYRAIGAGADAEAIAAAAALFPFPDPERDRDRRCELLAGPVGERVQALDSRLTDRVWELLAAFAHANESAFATRR